MTTLILVAAVLWWAIIYGWYLSARDAKFRERSGDAKKENEP